MSGNGNRRAERRPEIVVTGLGTVGAWGAGWRALEAALGAGQAPLTEVARPPGYHRAGAGRSRLASLVKEDALKGILPPAAARRMSWPSRLAVSAARLATADAGLAPGQSESAETGVAIATTYGPASFTEQLLTAIFGAGPEQASPALFTESVASAAASQISIDAKAVGPCLTITQREAGVLQAVGDAAGELGRGRSRRMLAGAVEEVTPLLHSILDRFGALARPEGGGAERARPFDRRRTGMLVAEGSTVVVLELAADAAARGARAWCRVVAAGSAFDPTSTPIDWGRDPSGLAESLRESLERAGLGLDAFDLVVSGAAGTRSGDRYEALVLDALWGGRGIPPMVAPKAVTGEYSGGFLAAAVLAVASSAAPKRPADFEMDPELAMAPAESLGAVAPRRALVTTLAPGGAATWLALERTGA